MATIVTVAARVDKAKWHKGYILGRCQKLRIRAELFYIIYMTYNELTDEEKRVIEGKATEPAFIGKYDNFYEPGTYICRKCNTPLFSSRSKFDAGCGWPAFDDSFPGAIKRIPDPDGMRTEIECAKCGGHLGHEFRGEFLTRKNTRECVNSLSIRFIPEGKDLPN